jgi:hypothetical protein
MRFISKLAPFAKQLKYPLLTGPPLQLAARLHG